MLLLVQAKFVLDCAQQVQYTVQCDSAEPYLTTPDENSGKINGDAHSGY